MKSNQKKTSKVKLNIKLYEIESYENIRRFQTQLTLGKDIANYVLEDGKMKCTVTNLVLNKADYKIVNLKEEMNCQIL